MVTGSSRGSQFRVLLPATAMIAVSCTGPRHDLQLRAAASRHPTAEPRATSTLRTCQQGHVVSSFHRSESDVSSGPLSYPNAQLLARPGTQRSYYGGGAPTTPDGSTFYKLGTFVQAGATVTVTLAESARSYARIHGPRNSPQSNSVTFEACHDGAATAWVGGFDLMRRASACVPLDVRVKGEKQMRRMTISFFSGGCAS